MFLAIFLHLLLDEAECTIYDLLVELQFGLLLVEIFLSSSDFDGVKVQKLILLLEYLEESLRLHPLMQNLVLDTSCQLDLLLVLRLHHLSLLLHFMDLIVKHFNLLSSLLFLFCNRLFDIQVFLALFSYHSVKFLDLSLIRFVLLIGLRDNFVLFRNLAASLLILLFID